MSYQDAKDYIEYLIGKGFIEITPEEYATMSPKEVKALADDMEVRAQANFDLWKENNGF